MTSDLPPTGGPDLPTDPPSASTQTPNPARSPRRALDDLFDRIRSIGLVRPAEGRWGGGVATSLARRFDVDVTLVRGVFVALSIVGGLGVAAYGLAWLLLPEEDGRIHLQQAIRGDFSAGFIGAVLLCLGAIGGGGGPGRWDNGWFGSGFPGGLILTALVVIGIYWYAKRSTPGGGSGGGGSGPGTGPWGGGGAGAPGPTEPPYGTPSSSWSGAGTQFGTDAGLAGEQARRVSEEAVRQHWERRQRSAPSRPIRALTLGLALIVFAGVQVLGRSLDSSAPVGLIASAGALAVLAAGVIASGLAGRRAAGLGALAVLLAIGVLAANAADHYGVRTGQNVAIAGSQTWRPASPQAAQAQFNLGVGEGYLWLTDPGITSSASPADPVDVSARLGAGHLVVVVPDDVPTLFRVSMGAGEIVNPDGTLRDVNDKHSGYAETVGAGPAGAPVLVVDVQQGVGQLELRRASSMTAPRTTTPTPTATPSPTATASPTASTN